MRPGENEFGEWLSGQEPDAQKIVAVSKLLEKICMAYDDGGCNILVSGFAELIGQSAWDLSDEQFELDIVALAEALRQGRAYEQSRRARIKS